MKSPKDMKGIMIDITNACFHKCSNCTRMCGHHSKPYFMSYETFVKAVDSFEGYEWSIGIMGGEPTLHPEFAKFCEYLQGHRYHEHHSSDLIKPTMNLISSLAYMDHERSIYEGYIRYVKGFGLWSAYGEKYIDNYEIIQDTFDFQHVNDHVNPMYHSPIMIRRSDMGINDEDWIKMRDNCWVQNEWSATVTPKGAFFCEVAAAIDMIIDGPGGWPIEKGWWKRTPDEFGEQLQLCEYCGVVLKSFSRNANDEIDDMSEWWYRKLAANGSPKVKKGLYNILKISGDGEILKESYINTTDKRKNDYADSYFSRFSASSNMAYSTKYYGVVFGVDATKKDQYVKCINGSKGILKKTIFVSCVEELNSLFELDEEVVSIIMDLENFGLAISMIRKEIKKRSVLIVLDEHKTLKNGTMQFLHEYIINPGTLLINCKESEEIFDGVKMILSANALTLTLCIEKNILTNLKSTEDFIDVWPKDKVINLKMENFSRGDYQIEFDKKYVLYGVGELYKKAINLFEKNQIVFCADSDEEKWGKEFCGVMCVSPQQLLENTSMYDKVFVSSKHYLEIRNSLINLGINHERIVSNLSMFGG